MAKKLTKQQAIKLFRELYKGSFERGDDVARREAWNNFTDSLCEDKQITRWQCDNWTNPF